MKQLLNALTFLYSLSMLSVIAFAFGYGFISGAIALVYAIPFVIIAVYAFVNLR